MADDIWRRHRAIWQEKPILQAIYGEWYREIITWLAPGVTVELGGGSGNFKGHAPQVISTDIVYLPWLNVVLDGQAIPFKTASVGNLVLVDVLHHVEQVAKFFDEAIRVLKPGGRIIIVDPYISWLSWPIYAWLHPEPVDLKCHPFELRSADPNRKPFDANQAVATVLFGKSFGRFRERFPKLQRVFQRRHAFIAYPLSGGFEHPSFLPMSIAGLVQAAERFLTPLGPWLAFRIFVVLEQKVP
jgi:SAM-dependent methyltransferase